MKVTVCFGSVRIVVPCGNGEIPVSELIEKSATRYRKAIGKSPEYWVRIHNLKSYSDGGILDPDDQLTDVADDREQIIAIYEEQGGHSIHHHNGGDGTSASSVGTSSPDIFQNGENGHVYLRQGGKNDVIITPSDLNVGSSLIVRRGSEPALNKVGVEPGPGIHPDIFPLKPSKRWSAIASIDEAKTNRDAEDEMAAYTDDTPPPTLQRVGGNGQEKESEPSNNVSFTTFARDSARRSLANNAALHKWLEAQERQQEQHLSRKDPVGSTAEDVDKQERNSNGISHHSSDTSSRYMGELITIKNTGGPLGIHVVPDYDQSGRDMGLVIQGIEAGGRIHRDGRLKVLDKISEINGKNLVDVNFSQSQEIFKQALQTEEIRLRVAKSSAPPLPKNPPPVLPKPSIAKAPSERSSASSLSAKSKSSATESSPSTSTPCKGERHPTSLSDIDISTVNDNNNNEGGGGVKGEPTSPSKKVPPAVPVRNPATALSAQTKSKIVAPTNTRRIGLKIYIELVKGAAGLGFSITTRDNLTGGHCPIYIKNILPKGAAVEDGQLKPGDRLLEVNSIEMTGKTQSEAVKILRNTKLGCAVNLVVSRQVADNVDDSKSLPRELSAPAAVPSLQPPDKAQDDDVSGGGAGKEKEALSFHIPLNESGAAGLGVSVKGKTSTGLEASQDLGIFIKSVITGGAASKDARLHVNDQLIEINKESLIGKTNQEAMGALRNAMQRDGPTPGYIDLKVLRRVGSSVLPSTPSEAECSVREVRISHSDAPVKCIAPAEDVTGADDTDGAVFAVPTGEPAQTIASKLAAEYALRNMSYQRATHESMLNETTDSVFLAPPPKLNNAHRPNKGILTANSTTLNTNRGETVLIEGENYQVQMRQNNDSKNVPKTRPASTLGFLEPQPPAKEKMTASKSNENLLDDAEGAPNPPGWLEEWDPERTADESELSPRDGEFSREGFGRQSMSEKRKGHVDPRMSEFYQKIKHTKDRHQIYSATWDPRKSAFRQVEGSGLKRFGSAESLLNISNNRASLGLALHENWLRITGDDEYQSEAELEFLNLQKLLQTEPSPVSGSASFHFPATKPNEVGPYLGLKKSSSLESLQTAVQDATHDEQDGGNVWRPPNRGMVRGRGCNESFRAAVDRSYEEQQPMDTLDEEGSENGSTRSRTSSLSVGEGGDKKAKKSNKPKVEKDKGDKGDKGGIFKGWGQMFKFGKHRKQLEDRAPQKSADELKKERKEKEKNKSQTNLAGEKGKPGEEEKAAAAAAAAAVDEQERVKEHYKKLQEKQRAHEAQKAREEQARAAMPPPLPPPSSRSEKIQSLRAEHQKRHRERQGQYPQDDREEQYEQRIQDYERQYPGTMSLQQELLTERGFNPVYAIPPRRRIEDPYDSRPGSRMGHSDPNTYSHYANFHEIQEQIKRHDYYQQRYHQYMAAQQDAARLHHDMAAQQEAARQHHDMAAQQEAARQHHAAAAAHAAGTPGVYKPSPGPDPRQQQQTPGMHDSRLSMHDSRQALHDPRLAMHDSRQSSASSIQSVHAVPYTSRSHLPPDPRGQRDPRDPRDPRHWPQGHYPSRSVTPGAERPRAPNSPGRARSQTPISQIGYGHHAGKPASASHVAHPGFSTPFDTYGIHRGRSYSEFADPRAIYHGVSGGGGSGREPSYGSLPRTRRERDPTLVSSSAQV